jgi:7,8-dihydropterin-6-yl-methyl-4-(beta-D-ribofuranosyl)aminobenzene 5'-phosphate synthase
MATQVKLNEVDKVEILMLQDNYVELTAMDHSAVVQRPMPLEGGEIRRSVQAEHGFSAFVTTTKNGTAGTVLLDFGFSAGGAAFNARSLNVPMQNVDVLALSHGHSDHFGGFAEMVKLIGKKGIELVVHPDVFRSPRYLTLSKEMKIYFPKITREEIERLGVRIVETVQPLPILDGDLLFLGEIERVNDFEKGFPIAYYEKEGQEKWDPIEDDTALAIHLKGKGLIVVSGCAHAGIVNTVSYARRVTGVEKVHAVIGGFHLSGPLFEAIIGRTTEELKKIGPEYIVPCHCTGRKAIMAIEREMPAQFILNMSGTRLTFSS